MNGYPSNEELYNQLAQSMATEYANDIADEIGDAVREDIAASAGPEPNEDDLRLAIGRVLCDRKVGASMKSAAVQVFDELNRVRDFLRHRVKLPELEIAVSRDLGVQLKAEYICACHDPNVAVVGIPPLAGSRIFVDDDLSGLQFRIVQTFPIKEVTDEN